jgi:hypothetical protein
MFAEDECQAERMADYGQELLDEVLESTQKPAGKCLALKFVAARSSAAALAELCARRPPEDMGTWVRRAMALVPLQISRCAGNTLEPMHDGEPRRNVGDNSDIVELSKELRLGLYEFLLNAHAGPVVVCCALGQQSVGKSYQLNHLGGALFDVAGGRCTDGGLDLSSALYGR